MTPRIRTLRDLEATVASLAVENEAIRSELDQAHRALTRLAEAVLAEAAPGTDLHSRALTAKYIRGHGRTGETRG